MTNRDIAFELCPKELPQSFRLEQVDAFEKELDKKDEIIEELKERLKWHEEHGQNCKCRECYIG